MYKKIINVSTLPKYKLVVTFENNEVKMLDMTPYLDKGIYSELKDINLFNTAHISFDTIEWANHADIDPEFVYEESSPYHVQDAI